MEKTLDRAKALEGEAIKIRRQLHENPEIGYDIPKTFKCVSDELKALGYQPTTCGQAGLVATLGKSGKTFLLRADMDALPIKEQTDLYFKSNNGYMHACGHDIHTSALLLAAKILKEREAELEGRVKLMFQPCEEGVDGANDMFKAGVLENPKVDAAMALHVVHENFGSVGYARGSGCGSSDVFKITVKGKGGHGAAPQNVVDPINIAVHIHLALQALNSREVHPDEMLVCTICQIHAGSASNIFPEEAVLEGSIRTMNNDVRIFAKERLIAICHNIAKTFRASAEVTFLHDGIPPLINDEEVLNTAIEAIDEALGDKTCYEMPRMTGSEDFSVISQQVPSVLFWVGTGSTEEGYPYGVHDARVTFNEHVIHKMATIHVETAMRWLKLNNSDS